MTKRTAKLAHEPWVLWPDGDPPPGGWPILLFLHGMGEAAWTERDGQPVEQSPDAVLAYGSPVALYRARDARVKTLWQSFVLIAPQAFNDVGAIGMWDWRHDAISRRVAAEVEQLGRSGKVDSARLFAAGFSRGGAGCLGLDASAGSLQFRKIATVDAQDLYNLAAAAQRNREVRVYYAPSTYSDILAPHRDAERLHGKAKPPINIITRPQSGKDEQAHLGMCPAVFAEDELYRWLLA